MNRRVKGEGPKPCNFMAVGEAPGYWENEYGRPFVGKSGRLLDTYLLRVGLPRTRMFITNVYPFWPGHVGRTTGGDLARQQDAHPTPTQIRRHRRYLLRDIRRVQPSYILALGRIAADFFGFNSTLEVSHGLPFVWRYRGRDIWVLPAFHPAAALRNPEISGRCFYDLKQFALIARGNLRPVTPTDIIGARVSYRLAKGVCIDGFEPAVDTEGQPGDPYCISYSTGSGKAEVVLKEDITPGQVLPPGRDKITLHHAMADLRPLREMGFKVRSDGYDDTILMARLLLLEPAGLKDLALRHLGMRMRTYNDVVGPYFKRAARRYIRRANRRDWGKPVEQTIFDKKTGKHRKYRPHTVNTRLAAILRDLRKNAALDVRARFLKISGPLRQPIERKMGAFPTSHPRLAPLKELVPYACQDADGTRRLKPKLWDRIVALKLQRAYETDLHAIPMFERMATNGMAVDLAHFSTIRPQIAIEMETRRMHWLRKWNDDRYFNLASGDALAEYLYGKLGLPILKMTEGGSRGKVDENTLELLKDRHPSIPEYMVWKKLHTNLTFVDRIPKHVRPDGRIYPNINTQGTVTGRPSTADPNLLNIPIRTDLGKKIRMGFVARPGRLLLSVDLAQIELRVGAHLSRDKEMIRAFKAGEDLHAQTARALGITRYIAKTINFGIFYGMSHIRLRSELLEAGIEQSERECREIISDWFRLYRGVRAWLEELFARARRRGFVRGISGRLRYLPNLYLPIGNPLRSEAERHCGNFPVQEGNAYVEKRGMWRVWQWLESEWAKGPGNEAEGIEPILQVYDELVFEAPESFRLGPIRSPAIEKIQRMMIADAGMFRVPLKADVALGARWGEL